MADVRKPVPPPRPSVEHGPTRPPTGEYAAVRGRSEGSGPRRSESSGGYPLPPPRELADALADAIERAVREMREASNREVNAQVDVLTRKHLAAQLQETRADLQLVDHALVRWRRAAITAAVSILVGAVTWVTERMTAQSVASVVEQRAAPIEQRAAASAVVAETAEARQAALEARSAARDAQLERLIRALEAKAAPPK